MSNPGLLGFSSGEEGWGIAQVRLGSVIVNNQPSLDITNLITNTFDKYLIELLDVYPSTDNVKLFGLVSSTNGLSWITSGQYAYIYHTIYSSPFSGVGTNNGTATSIELASEQGNQPNEKINGTLDLRNPQSLFYKHIEYRLSSISQHPYFKYSNGVAFSKDASPINALRLYFSSGNISGKATIYGVN